MWMSSNVRTILVTRDENNHLSVQEVDENQINEHDVVSEDLFMHPILIALTHSLIVGDAFEMDLEEEKNKLTDDEFKNLESCAEITNCAICLENKKLNIKLKCGHIFCKGCIKKWLIEKSNTCPNCRIEI